MTDSSLLCSRPVWYDHSREKNKNLFAEVVCDHLIGPILFEGEPSREIVLGGSPKYGI